MGFALVNTVNDLVLSWSPYDEPIPGPNELVIIEDELIAPRNELRWDGADGLRLATPQELLIGTPRPYIEIKNDLALLSSAQKQLIWDDLMTVDATGLKKINAQGKDKADVLDVWEFIGTRVTLTAVNLAELKLRAVTVFVEANPLYLVHPPFDPSINVPGLYF